MRTDIFRKGSLTNARFFKACKVDGNCARNALLNPAIVQPLVAVSGRSIVHRRFPRGEEECPRQRVFQANELLSHSPSSCQSAKDCNRGSGDSLSPPMAFQHRPASGPERTELLG